MLKTRVLGFILLMFILIGLRSPLPVDAVRITSLKLISPGEGSCVISPIEISAQVQTQLQHLIRITLVDRSGTEISRQLLRVESDSELPQDFTTSLAFEIPREFTDGLLTIAIQDENSRLVALRSTPLKLQSDGENSITSQSSTSDWLTVTQPQPGERLQGGMVIVEGTLIAVIDRPVFFELITDSGGQIGSRQLAVQSAGVPITFNVILPYGHIYKERDVRLIMRQTDEVYGKNIVLDSVPIYLSP
ncbi:MAG: hypothetical protein SVP52_05845 [Chloroflexota bacterium]|nr:hypothetical protein [Chloroflexota bacterium]